MSGLVATCVHCGTAELGERDSCTFLHEGCQHFGAALCAACGPVWMSGGFKLCLPPRCAICRPGAVAPARTEPRRPGDAATWCVDCAGHAPQGDA